MGPDRIAQLEELLTRRILVLDGAMGTMIQTYQLGERDYRGERFCDCDRDVAKLCPLGHTVLDRQSREKVSISVKGTTTVQQESDMRVLCKS